MRFPLFKKKQRLSKKEARKIINTRTLPRKAPKRLNFRLLFRAFGIAALVGIGFAANSFNKSLLVDDIQLHGTFDKDQGLQARKLVFELLKGEGFFSLPLKDIAHNLETFTWVETVGIRKDWPSTLHVQIISHKPVARLNSEQYISSVGEVFSADNLLLEEIYALPNLVAPEDKAQEVIDFYAQISSRLASYDLSINTFELMENNSWRLMLSSGTELRLNYENAQQRLDDFMFVMEKYFLDRMTTISHIDLRYQQGFAVRWNEEV